MQYHNSLEFARMLDEGDSLSAYRNQFHIPVANGKEQIYFTGNSLGLQPKTTKDYLIQELNDWAQLGVEGHFHAKNPWFPYHTFLRDQSARIVGALPSEVVVMNQLTVNLHLMLISFYQPTSDRYRIIFEKNAFPSDRYAFQSHAYLHGFELSDALIELEPREGEYTLRTEDILRVIEENEDSLALVCLGGVNYYTGQVFDIKSITLAAHKAGAKCGFDLAHAAGNINLELHKWNVDFSVWCSYKYLNSGPGGVAGCFVHQHHGADFQLPRLAGWWGNDPTTRFEMPDEFIPAQGADGWQLSNAPVLSMAAHRASLEIFDKAGMANLIAKSKVLTGYLFFILHDIIIRKKLQDFITIITPENDSEHGCQVSLLFHRHGRKFFDHLTKSGVVADWRDPDVIRVAPVPLYNTFTDVYQLGQVLEQTPDL